MIVRNSKCTSIHPSIYLSYRWSVSSVSVTRMKWKNQIPNLSSTFHYLVSQIQSFDAKSLIAFKSCTFPTLSKQQIRLYRLVWGMCVPISHPFTDAVVDTIHKHREKKLAKNLPKNKNWFSFTVLTHSEKEYLHCRWPQNEGGAKCAQVGAAVRKQLRWPYRSHRTLNGALLRLRLFLARNS